MAWPGPHQSRCLEPTGLFFWDGHPLSPLGSLMAAKPKPFVAHLVTLLVGHPPEEVAAMLLETDPEWFDCLVGERLRERLEDAVKRVVSDAKARKAQWKQGQSG
jgi:hypothetical protein